MRKLVEGMHPFHVFIASAVSFIVIDVFNLFAGRTVSLTMMLVQFAVPTVLACIAFLGHKIYHRQI